MIFIKKEILKNYISKITKTDIENYIKSEKVKYEQNELDLIYYEIKNNNEKILNNFKEYILNFKTKLNNELYSKIIEKYNKYKKFIE